MLFQEIVYGPIRSRRLGNSLGINLMPAHEKVCSFNCVYCECGWTKQQAKETLPTIQQFSEALEAKLKVCDAAIDVITFSGNGEPTMHPDFLPIMQETVRLRNQYTPQTRIAVLSNSTMLHREAVFKGLLLADDRILKLDSGKTASMRLIDMSLRESLTVEEIVRNLALYDGNFALQTCFLTGEYKGQRIDNTTDEEIAAWLDCVKRLHPKQVMMYCIDRVTPCETLQKVAPERMYAIAAQVEALGIPTVVSL